MKYIELSAVASVLAS